MCSYADADIGLTRDWLVIRSPAFLDRRAFAKAVADYGGIRFREIAPSRNKSLPRH